MARIVSFVHRQAVFYSLVLFGVLFMIHATVLALVFSIFVGQLGPVVAAWSFKLIGYLTWAIPGYTAVRIAGNPGLLQALWVGIVEAIFIGSLATLTLTAEHIGTIEIVRNTLLTSGFVMLAALTGGWLGHWRNRARDKRDKVVQS